MKNIFLIILFAIFAAQTFAEIDYSDPDPATDFEEIENPTADDLLQVPNPTLDDFNRLSFEEQQQYLLIEYNTEFAAAYVSTSDFISKNDRVIAQQFYAEEPQHINDDPDGFSAFLKQEGVAITLIGEVIDYDEKGNLYGNNQKINLNALKKSPAGEEYRIVVDKNNNIVLYTEYGKDSVSFTGTLEVHDSGRFILREGTINGISVKEGYYLEFDDQGELAGGTVTEYGGIRFAEPTVIKTREEGSILTLEDAALASVAPETSIKVEGHVVVEDYNAIKGTILVPAEAALVVNNIAVLAVAPEELIGEDVEVRFGDTSSTELGTTFVRFTDKAIMLNGQFVRLGFSAQDFVAGKEIAHEFDVLLAPVFGTTTLSTDGTGITISGRRTAALIGDELYSIKDGKAYKVIEGEHEPLQIGELQSDGPGTNIDVPVHFIPEEEGGVALTLKNELTSLYEETGKPTVRGSVIAALDLAEYELTGDAEGMQKRLDAIDRKLQTGQGISVEDQEFLLSLYGSVATGGFVIAGPNAGAALGHYFSGNGEELEVDSDMFEDSTIVTHAMSSMEEEIHRQVESGASEGSFSSFSCDCVEEVKLSHVEISEGNMWGVTDGMILEGGIISTYSNIDPDLFYTNHNFPLAVQWEKKPDGTIEATWSVDDPYDFKRTFQTGEVIGHEDIPIPILFSDKTVSLTDGVAAAMGTELGLAKPFNIHSEWETTLIQ